MRESNLVHQPVAQAPFNKRRPDRAFKQLDLKRSHTRVLQATLARMVTARQQRHDCRLTRLRLRVDKERSYVRYLAVLRTTWITRIVVPIRCRISPDTRRDLIF